MLDKHLGYVNSMRRAGEKDTQLALRDNIMVLDSNSAIEHDDDP